MKTVRNLKEILYLFVKFRLAVYTNNRFGYSSQRFNEFRLKNSKESEKLWITSTFLLTVSKFWFCFFFWNRLCLFKWYCLFIPTPGSLPQLFAPSHSICCFINGKMGNYQWGNENKWAEKHIKRIQISSIPSVSTLHFSYSLNPEIFFPAVMLS